MAQPYVVGALRGFVRGVVEAVSGKKKLRAVQTSLRWQEETEYLEHAETYGYTASPFDGAEAVVLRIGEGPDHQIVISTPDRRYRLQTLARGEVALYDDLGSVVRLGRDGIHVSATGVCNVTATGVCTVEGSSIKLGATATKALPLWTDLKTWLNTHTHSGGGAGAPNVAITDAAATTKTVAE